jgi:hypothetical protein
MVRMRGRMMTAEVELRHVGVQLQLIWILIVVKVVGGVTATAAAAIGGCSGAAIATAATATTARIQRGGGDTGIATGCESGRPGAVLMVMVVEHGERVVVGDHGGLVHHPALICTNIFPLLLSQSAHSGKGSHLILNIEHHLSVRV